MKKDDQKITLLNSDIASNDDLKRNNFKTTDINILLNRVRLNKRHDSKKKIILLALILGMTISISLIIIV